MQSLGWYVRRVGAMSSDEIVWRVRSEIRDAVDAVRVPLGLYPRVAGAPTRAFTGVPRWCAIPLAAWRDAGQGDRVAEWRARLVQRADRIAAHRLSFFDLDDVDLGTPIDWNRDHATGRRAPMTFAASIDYRDYAVTGDAKVVWEPNRHHQFVVLGRAYRATGDRKYAAALIEQMDSWIDACPFGVGMNWRSPLELAIRVINWVWALDLVADCGLLTERFQARVLQSIALHVWDIDRKYSRGSSANNHRIGEACGVFTAASYFADLPDARRLRDASSRILAEEIAAQTYASGATREQALGYQFFVLQLFLCAGVADRRSSNSLPAAFWARLQRMFAFVATLAEGGPLPTFGDSDDGYVLDLGDPPHDVDALLDVASELFAGESAQPRRPNASETAYWLFGPSQTTAGGGRSATPNEDVELESTALEDAGLYLLQWGARGSRDRVSVVFDCGELGFGAIAAHGHADALALVVRAFGVEVLVDPGTYDYFTYPEWRRYFRSTRAHNTVVVDGEDQSDQLGSFLWGRRATARCVRWSPSLGGGLVAGEHDGFAVLSDPVICRRTLDLDRVSRTLTITDEVAATGSHEVSVMFHFAEQCTARQDGRQIAVDTGAGMLTLALDERLSVSLVRGGTPAEGGWVSRGYHRKAAAWTVWGRIRTSGTTTLRSVLTIGRV